MTNEDSESISDRFSLLENILPGIAHQLNNHSQTIILTCQLLAEIWGDLKQVTDRYFEQHGEFSAGGLDYSVLRADLEGYYSNILQGAQQIERTVSAFRELVPRTPDKGATVLNLNDLVDECVALMANTILKATDNSRTSPDPHLPPIRGRGPHLRQVIIQLIVNLCGAIQAREQALEIATRYDRTSRSVLCLMKIRGEGMPPEATGRIRAFLSGTGPNPGKMFPGLAAVKYIMKDHGGNIDFSSKPDAGMRIALSFPPEEPS
jgi:two-component system NtrC family sensor kinase